MSRSLESRKRKPHYNNKDSTRHVKQCSSYKSKHRPVDINFCVAGMYPFDISSELLESDDRLLNDGDKAALDHTVITSKINNCPGKRLGNSGAQISLVNKKFLNKIKENAANKITTKYNTKYRLNKFRIGEKVFVKSLNVGSSGENKAARFLRLFKGRKKYLYSYEPGKNRVLGNTMHRHCVNSMKKFSCNFS